ncbi:SMI1/KNR4 family protein [Streptomyces sp. NBC_00151]|uniref:SMI1/KNR4 family protein n=1 Tax=Streptomyces sp. NBC_00151 TaxID=2975669 RepID=UPI002DD87347|nr:SMI1/KNR4 family protein [Streptomyces sp. NBC_00151]WRZ36945.1 SMI1/KNR4 family protein [Streptomyces sp. NBC_00151]
MSAHDDQIVQAERRFEVRFPEDYRRFLAAEGSIARLVPPADDFLMINTVEELIAVNEAGDFQERFPGSVVIGGDGSREMLTYDFRQEPLPLVLLDVSAQDWSSASIRHLRSLPCSISFPKPDGNGTSLNSSPPDGCSSRNVCLIRPAGEVRGAYRPSARCRAGTAAEQLHLTQVVPTGAVARQSDASQHARAASVA